MAIQPPEQFDLPSFVTGDTWDGIGLIGPVTINNAAPAAQLVLARIHFRKAFKDISAAYILSTAPSSGQGSITLVSASLWTLTVPRQALPLKAGTWKWDLELVDADAVKKTYVGGTIVVTPEVTV